MKITPIVWAGILLLAGSAAAQDGGRIIQKTMVALGTATPGGGFPLYGNAFAELMNEADPTLSIAPRNTKGRQGEHSPSGAGAARYCAGGGGAGL
jgi:uncharacterized protein